MCGIIGFNYEDNDFLKKAMHELEHRGPDASGIFCDKNVSLGHRRLSIIDLSEKGKQPMSNKNGTIWIIFNGEIYNFKELRKELEKRHEFNSNTDTEVLIYLYEEEGIGFLKKLNGMFAFCIYDSIQKLFFLVRDRVGIKPIYYYSANGKFIFASEIKAILKDKQIKRQINLDSLSSFLIFRANIEEETIFKGIKKLLPGHFLIYNLKTKKEFIQKYWDLQSLPEKRNKNYFIKKLKQLLDDSVRLRLMSDVPYGAYLSGGVDSGTMVSLMKNYSSDPIKTFSVGFEKGEDSETNEAKFLSEKLETEHHELFIKEDSVKFLPDIIYQADEPMADPTSIPLYFLSKYAKKYCTVIQTGEGADEIFAGYPQYKFIKIHNLFLRRLPFAIRKQIPVIIKLTPKEILNKGFKFASSLGEKGIERFSNFVNTNNYSKQYLQQISIFNEQEQSELFNKKIYFHKYSINSFDGCLKFDFKGNMVDDLLMKVDKNTMKFSVEGRVPFLDHRIVELAFNMPNHFKLKGLTKDKYILRESVKSLIPEQTRKRKKRHFFVPIDDWFKNELLTLKQELLEENFLKHQGIFEISYINKINKNFKYSKLFYSRQLWSLITFQIWYKQYIENEKIKI